jgi:hypothetical protein
MPKSWIDRGGGFQPPCPTQFNQTGMAVENRRHVSAYDRSRHQTPTPRRAASALSGDSRQPCVGLGLLQLAAAFGHAACCEPRWPASWLTQSGSKLHAVQVGGFATKRQRLTALDEPEEQTLPLISLPNDHSPLFLFS